VTIPPYIQIAGRPALYDRLNQAVKRIAPAWFIRLGAAFLAYPRRVRNARRFRRQMAKVLPPQSRSSFETMYADALRRWAVGPAEKEQARVTLPVSGGGRQIELRVGTSDILAYADIILHEQYAAPVAPPVSFVLDAGANVGITAAYLLDRFPDARLVALEPDPINAALCRSNLTQFGSRATVLQAALTPTPTRVRMRAALQGTWAASIDEDPNGEIEGIDVASLCARFGVEQIDILKIDIEGAELELFSHPDRTWLARVRTVLVELESAASEAAFFSALSTQPFRYARYGEITAATRVGERGDH